MDLSCDGWLVQAGQLKTRAELAEKLPSEQVPSNGALPWEAWMALGIRELVCTGRADRPRRPFRWQPALSVVAATVLTIKSLVFVWVHGKYGKIAPIILSGVLGLLMAFIADGRMVLKPI